MTNNLPAANALGLGARRPDGVTLFRWPLDEPAAVVEELAAKLDPDEHARARAFTRDEPRRRFVVARARLRQLLAERLGVAPREVAFAYGPNGKPALAGEPSTHFNLAHSADLALCAVADRPVGVDLERVRPMKNAPALAERWFHPEEVTRIAAATDPLAEFFRTWVMKEAALKLVGVGVGESLPRVLTPAAPEGGPATGLPPNALQIDACRVERLEVEPGYVAALATVV